MDESFDATASGSVDKYFLGFSAPARVQYCSPGFEHHRNGGLGLSAESKNQREDQKTALLVNAGCSRHGWVLQELLRLLSPVAEPKNLDTWLNHPVPGESTTLPTVFFRLLHVLEATGIAEVVEEIEILIVGVAVDHGLERASLPPSARLGISVLAQLSHAWDLETSGYGDARRSGHLGMAGLDTPELRRLRLFSSAQMIVLATFPDGSNPWRLCPPLPHTSSVSSTHQEPSALSVTGTGSTPASPPRSAVVDRETGCETVTVPV